MICLLSQQLIAVNYKSMGILLRVVLAAWLKQQLVELKRQPTGHLTSLPAFPHSEHTLHSMHCQRRLLTFLAKVSLNLRHVG